MKEEFKFDPASKPFDTQFVRYPLPAPAIITDAEGVRFTLTTATKKPEVTGIYSAFTLGGDFEVAVDFDWMPVVVPKGGYGVSVGISVEANEKFNIVKLARGNFQGKGSAYRVTMGIRNEKGQTEYKKNDDFETKAKNGKMILMRKKKDLFCMIVEGTEEPKELCKLPYTDAAIQKVHFFADPGNAPTDMDARLSQARIRADEITHHMTRQERRSTWPLWVGGGTFLALCIGAVFIYRRMSNKE